MSELQRTAFLRGIPHQPSRTLIVNIEELVADCSVVPAAAAHTPILGP